ncbi:MAG: PP0621 family protein [Pseudomonadota bacterium]
MFRLILLILIAYVFYSLWQRAGKRAETKKKLPGEMVECESCGTYTVIESAYKRGGKYYCTKDCKKEKK